MTRTAAAFAGRGYQVILEGIFGPWFLPVVADELRPTRLAVHHVVLHAPLDVALSRVQRRIGHERDHVVQQLYAAFRDLGPYAAHVVDTGLRDAEAVASGLDSLLDRGAFILDISRVPSPGLP